MAVASVLALAGALQLWVRDVTGTLETPLCLDHPFGDLSMDSRQPLLTLLTPPASISSSGQAAPKPPVKSSAFPDWFLNPSPTSFTEFPWGCSAASRSLLSSFVLSPHFNAVPFSKPSIHVLERSDLLPMLRGQT